MSRVSLRSFHHFFSVCLKVGFASFGSASGLRVPKIAVAALCTSRFSAVNRFCRCTSGFFPMNRFSSAFEGLLLVDLNVFSAVTEVFDRIEVFVVRTGPSVGFDTLHLTH